MYAGKPGPSYSQSNTKSCIQALLKNREQQSALSKSSTNNFKADTNNQNCPSSATSPLDTPINLEDLQDANEANCSQNLDNQKDFNYSQKLFHIDDGNLYSIFSPIQGRSYGMKPSFLRKQKYTVQECHSRGRKSHRKGLKFHNFLPSESVTSEKDNGYQRNKWKVHSECRLREEHGTKQITISNWSQSVQNSSIEPVNLERISTKPDVPLTIAQNSSNRQSISSTFKNLDPYDFNLSLQSTFDNSNIFSKSLKETTTTVTSSKARDVSRSAASKKDSLTFVLNSLLDKPEACDNRNLTSNKLENHLKPHLNLKRRRKPVQTRKVVPYVKYLSIMEENDSVPLDLSSKCSLEATVPSPSNEDLKNCQDIRDLSYVTNSNSNTIVKRESPAVEFDANISSMPHTSTNSLMLEDLLQNKIPMPLMFFSPQVTNGYNITPTIPDTSKNMAQDYGKSNMTLNNKQLKFKNVQFPNNGVGQSLLNNPQYTIHKSFIKEPSLRNRKRNQRSVIKQKLEDTFKQNGFLVKTKQVSDGEATFCKFRQLRKYTRYYLKSWQQHLPDEVNKMWKGFLPPKTVLPPTAGTSEPNSETS